MKKEVLFGIIGGVALLLVLLIYFIFFTGGAETETSAIEAVDAAGVLVLTQTHSRFDTAEVQLFYESSECREVIEPVLAALGETVTLIDTDRTSNMEKVSEAIGFDVDQQGIEFPVLVISGSGGTYDSTDQLITSGDVQSIVAGPSACVDQSLFFQLCRLLDYVPEVCAAYQFGETRTQQPRQQISSAVCYQSCLIEYNVGSLHVSSEWQGPPCDVVTGYIPGNSSEVLHQCVESDSCDDNVADTACCNVNRCAYDGKCYDPLSKVDVAGDGQREVCIPLQDNGYWMNADRDPDVCNAAGFRWFDCVGDECKGIKDNYNSKRDGACCGDEEAEHITSCEGDVCGNAEDIACCGANSCTFDGTCYKEGCATLKINNQTEIVAYCQGGSWVDLDKDFCATCLGKNSASEFVCCGDDPDEGKYPSSFSFINGSGFIETRFESCVDTRDSCVVPDIDTEFVEGCYDFNENDYLSGQFVCEEGIWRDPDNNSKFCGLCGGDWMSFDFCCGDDIHEHRLTGEDGTVACCLAASDTVVNGQCMPNLSCGNARVEAGEQCEDPNTRNNQYCQQSVETCRGVQTGIRDNLGVCNDDCNCEVDDFDYVCVKDSCGAGCGSDDDCGDSGTCDPVTCSCREKTFCGDGVVQERNDNNWFEQCESPATIFNPHCNETTACFGSKTGLRYGYGGCNSDCLCSYSPFEKLCVKGSCGSTCNHDGTGCPDGFACDINTCGCQPTDAVCGNDICEPSEEFICARDCNQPDCPSLIDVDFDQVIYGLNETAIARITVYDANGEELAFSDFFLDVLVNGNFRNTESHTTDSGGRYERREVVKRIEQSTSTVQVINLIAKSELPNCELKTDTARALYYVSDDLFSEFNLSRFNEDEFLRDFSGLGNEAQCGNNLVEAGESCEGSLVCRGSRGCNYLSRTYDIPELCSTCFCPLDIDSQPDDDIYCANCGQHCGDGVVNCNEDCEEGDIDRGPSCRDGKLYNRIDQCSDSCSFLDDGTDNDVLISNCFCDCPESPGQCVGGDWIEYRSDYAGGCEGGACNECNCFDSYTKDTNSDGIEDKCSLEVCDNGIDDNDNGLIDMNDPECSICINCGIGLFNMCDELECSNLMQSCFFEQTSLLFGTGSCFACEQSTCEDYATEEICGQNTCGFSCRWQDDACCTDTDQDGLCDVVDNCDQTPNVDQTDSDGDGLGDACDVCAFEQALFIPESDIELSCADDIDNNCNQQIDCFDPTCDGRAPCCAATDCVNSDGLCVAADSYDVGENEVCFGKSWFSCHGGSEFVCESFVIHGENVTDGKTVTCSYNGSTWDWRSVLPLELCGDAIDNNCNGFVDLNDSICIPENE